MNSLFDFEKSFMKCAASYVHVMNITVMNITRNMTVRYRTVYIMSYILTLYREYSLLRLIILVIMSPDTDTDTDTGTGTDTGSDSDDGYGQDMQSRIDQRVLDGAHDDSLDDSYLLEILRPEHKRQKVVDGAQDEAAELYRQLFGDDSGAGTPAQSQRSVDESDDGPESPAFDVGSIPEGYVSPERTSDSESDTGETSDDDTDDDDNDAVDAADDKTRMVTGLEVHPFRNEGDRIKNARDGTEQDPFAYHPYTAYDRGGGSGVVASGNRKRMDKPGFYVIQTVSDRNGEPYVKFGMSDANVGSRLNDHSRNTNGGSSLMYLRLWGRDANGSNSNAKKFEDAVKAKTGGIREAKIKAGEYIRKTDDNMRILKTAIEQAAADAENWD